MSLLTRTPSEAADSGEDADPARGDATPVPGRAGRGRRTTPPSASVNLLSPWVVEELALRQLRLRFLTGGLVLAMLLAAGWAWLQLDLGRTRSGLAADEAANVQLTGQLSDLDDVRSYVTSVNRRTDDIESVMGRQVAVSTVVSTLEEMLPDGSGLTSAELTIPIEPELIGGDAGATAEGSVCPGADPYGTQPIVGCLQFTGTAPDRESVSTFVQRLDRRDLFVEPFVRTTVTGDLVGGETGATPGASAVEFTGSIGLAPRSWTLRFVELDDTATDQNEEQGE